MKFKYNIVILIEPERRLLSGVEDLTQGVWYRLATPIHVQDHMYCKKLATHIRRSNYTYDEEFRLGTSVGHAEDIELVSTLLTLSAVRRANGGLNVYILTEGEINVNNDV